MNPFLFFLQVLVVAGCGTAKSQEVGVLNEQVVHPEDFGADPTGTNDSSLAIQNAINALPRGGRVEPKTRYPGFFKIEKDIVVDQSGIVIDWKGNTLHSGKSVRFFFTGDRNGRLKKFPQESERRLRALQGGQFRNAVIGKDAGNLMKGPHMSWCQGCAVENVTKEGPTSTAFNFYACFDCTMKNIINRGAGFRPSGGASIGVLVHMSYGTILEGVEVKDGPFSFGIQIKGGRNNRVIGSAVKGIQASDAATNAIAVYLRGDAPWKKSNTLELAEDGIGIHGFTYPVGTLNPKDPDVKWSLPDLERATQDVWVDGITISSIGESQETNSDPKGVGVVIQEAQNVELQGVTIDGVGTGISLRRLGGGQEKNLRVRNFQITHASREGINTRYLLEYGENYPDGSYPLGVFDGGTIKMISGKPISCETKFARQVINVDPAENCK